MSIIQINSINPPSLIKINGQNDPEITAYVSQFFTILKTHSIYKDQIDWNTLETKLLKASENIKRIADLQPIFQDILNEIDNHSLFVDSATATSWIEGTCQVNMPTGKLLPNRIGYLYLPACLASDQKTADKYAQNLHELIKKLDQSNLNGWIIDLRGNIGGNMYPMLAGLGPFFKQGVIGKFMTSHCSSDWYYQNGVVSHESTIYAKVTNPYITSRALPVALLTDKNTASAAEAVAIALKSLPTTRSFGSPTAGRTTSNEKFQFSDGSYLFLATSWFADALGKTYPSCLIPNQRISSVQNIIQTASKWILHNKKQAL